LAAIADFSKIDKSDLRGNVRVNARRRSLRANLSAYARFRC
jgi:hypothetical protein